LKLLFKIVPVRVAILAQRERLAHWVPILKRHHHDVPADYRRHIQPFHELLHQELFEEGREEEAEIDCFSLHYFCTALILHSSIPIWIKST
jgi:hypothetical protein